MLTQFLFVASRHSCLGTPKLRRLDTIFLRANRIATSKLCGNVDAIAHGAVKTQSRTATRLCNVLVG